VDDLTFANGVAIDPSGRFLIVAETGEYRIHKISLDSTDKGQSSVILDNLPGFPDNVHIGQNGRYWIGLAAPRVKILDDLASKPFLRKVVQRLPGKSAISDWGCLYHHRCCRNRSVYLCKQSHGTICRKVQ